jgi:hypothetical protein
MGALAGAWVNACMSNYIDSICSSARESCCIYDVASMIVHARAVASMIETFWSYVYIV